MVASPRTGKRRLLRVAPLRLRITAVAVVVVGLALAAGSGLLVQQLRTSLIDTAASNAKLRAGSIATALAGNPNVDSAALSTFGDDDEDEFIQILQGATVVASTANMADEPASPTGDNVDVPFDSDSFVVARADVTTSAGPRTVVVGASLEDARDATGSLIGLLLIGFPAMVLVVGAVTWFVVGRTLAPVDRIRREADEIGAAQLHRRLPEPARHDEIGRLADTMNRMLDRLDQGQKQQRQFVSDAAHELRSPIASIKQNVEVAAAYPDQLSAAELAETVLAESVRLERLVSALLSLARLDERDAPSSDGPVDLDDIVFEEAQRLRHTTSLRIDVTGVSAGRVAGDTSLLTQAIRNLVDNAQRHAATTIALTLAESGSTVVLDVEDDGPGIPARDRLRVFERFVRLDEARARDDGGSGLGLAIVDTIVTAYGGTVAVSDSRFGGALVRVSLPRYPD